MKLNLYSQIINKMISSLDLAMHLNGQVDDIIFEVLFKGQIAELFHWTISTPVYTYIQINIKLWILR